MGVTHTQWQVGEMHSGGTITIRDGRTVIAEVKPVLLFSADRRRYDVKHGETEATARLIAEAPAMREAIADLFEHCAMVHKHWGEGDNTKQANAAIERARALLARIDGNSEPDGTEGQDRDSYSDTQDRDSYSVDDTDTSGSER